MGVEEQILLDEINTNLQTLIQSGNAVSSVFGRVGAVVAANGDYTASNITNVAAGTISAITIQAAINELDTEKVAKTGSVFIWLPAEAAYLPATNPAVLTEILGATTYAGWSILVYDDTTAQMAVWRVPLPGYNNGNITVTAFSKPATTPAGNVTLQYNIYTIGLANDETFNTAVLTDTTVNISHALTTTTLSTEIAIASATIDPANVATDDLLLIGIERDVATDDLSGNGQLLGILLTYTRV